MKQRSPSSVYFWIAVFCCVTAIGVHSYLTKHHLDLEYGTSTGDSICNINQHMDCDSVNTSVFSELLGAPLALWGSVSNAALLLLLLWAKATAFRNLHLNRICFVFAAIIALASVVMLLISYTQLNTFCLFCMISYAASFGLLLGVWKMAPMELKDYPSTITYLITRGDGGGFSYLVFLLAVPVAVFLFNGMMRSSFGANFKVLAQDSLAAWNSNTAVNIDTRAALHLKDPNQTYRMQVVEFADFNCPHCRHAAPTLHAFAKSRKDVQFIFMNFPLDGTCNSAIPQPGQTCLYAKATLCGNQQNQGWEVHDWLFENQGKFENLERLVTELKMDPVQFKSCLESSTTHEEISKQATEGKTAGVQGTPTIFVNGRQLPGGQYIPVLTEVYNNIK